MAVLTKARKRAVVKGAPAPPGPPGSPILGNMRALLKDNLQFVMDMANQYGDVVHYRLARMPIYQVNHPDGVQRILQDNNNNYSKDSLNFGFIRMLLGNGLVSSDGEFWLRQRRLMQPAFHRRHIAAFGEMMLEETLAMLAEWQVFADRGEPIDVSAKMMRLTLGIVNRALFTSHIGETAEKVRPAMSFLAEDIAYRFQHPYYPPPGLPTVRNRSFLTALRSLESVIYGIIDERRQLLARGPDPGRAVPNDLLTLLLTAEDEETGERMSNKQLRDEVMTLFIAGHETTSNLLTWSFWLLSKHPDVARRLYSELDQALAGEAPSVDNLSKLTYARMVIEETMRLYPPAWIMNRQSLEDDIVCGYGIPADSFVAISPYITHRHPDFWDNPEGFDPERFSPERSEERPRYAYFPFGGGPRQCIGKGFALVEAQMILAAVAQRYELQIAPGRPVVPSALATLRPRHGLLMTLRRRDA